MAGAARDKMKIVNQRDERAERNMFIFIFITLGMKGFGSIAPVLGHGHC